MSSVNLAATLEFGSYTASVRLNSLHVSFTEVAGALTPVVSYQLETLAPNGTWVRHDDELEAASSAALLHQVSTLVATIRAQTGLRPVQGASNEFPQVSAPEGNFRVTDED